ncbi:MAG TPA: DUF3857 domain-containing protein [Thermoanaerobaculia bacterium]|nr:DUF3857 domain-containing protein [Thermoanaerobaculia bacterium]
MRSASLSRQVRLAAIGVLFAIALPAVAATAPPAPPTPAKTPASPWSGAAFATPSAALLAAAQALPPATDLQVDFLLFESHLTLDADGLWSERRHQIYRVLDASAIDDWAYVEEGWSPWHQLRPELRARVIGLDGTERWLDPKTIAETSSGEDSAVMFDDGKVLRAPLPAVEAGAIVEIETSVRDQRALFSAGSVRRLTFPNDHLRLARVEVDAAATAPFHWVRRLLPETGPVERLGGGRRVLTFEWRDLAFKNEYLVGLPSDTPWYPYLAFSSGATWQNVAATYSDVVDHALAGADVRTAVETASAGAADQTQVIDRLLAYLQGQVRYTGVEFDDAGIVPRSPTETLARRFGDCKDKSALLVALLRAADIPAYLALLSGGWGSDVDPELPGLGAFNHAIVYVPASPPIWIDATEELARAGELPSSDRDRWALVAAPGTKTLQKTPAPVAAGNLLRRTRTITLAELGKAKIVEENEYHGDLEIWARRNLGMADEKTRKEWLANYSKSYFLTDQIGPYQAEGAQDLSRPFHTRLEIPASPRGSTDLNEAAVGIRLENLIERLPDVFLQADDADDQDTADAEDDEATEVGPDSGADSTAPDPASDSEGTATAGTAPDAKPVRRAQPFVFRDPFVTEWRYEIHPPPGFAVRELPESKTDSLGPAALERRYRTLPDGVLEATFRFDSGKVRLTPQEYEALREKTLALAEGEPILLYFDQVGAAALNQGKVTEALAEFRRLASTYPDRALYPLQISRALLAGGLQEAAKAEAERAVALAPRLADAQQNLGWVLEHDPLGRLRGAGGIDRPGSVAAYKKAVALDPDNDVAKADLAILLEFDDAGKQFAKGADLETAGSLYRELHDKGLNGLDVNLMNNLLQRGKLDELKKFATKLDASEARQQYLATALALLDGPDAASRLARGVADRDQRVAMLALAGQHLLRSRRYVEAGKLFQILASVAPDGATKLGVMQQLASVRRWEEVELPARVPATFTVRLFLLALQGKLSPADAKGYLSRRLLAAEVDHEVASLTSKDFLSGLDRSLSADGDSATLQLGLDMAVSLLRSQVDGDDDLGYRIRSRFDSIPTALAFTVFVVREEGEYRLLGDNKDWPPVGRLVLELAAAGKLDDARRWLDWVRDEVKDDEDRDPYGRAPFARLWSAGQAGDLAAIRAAAAVLLVATRENDTKANPSTRAAIEEGLARIAELRPAATGDTAVALDLATWNGLETLERWSDLAALLERLVDEQPGSDRALYALFFAQRRNGHAEDIAPRLEARRAKSPNDPTVARLLADLAEIQGDIPRSLDLTRALVDRGKPEAEDFNRLAWDQLFQAPVHEQALTDAARASEMSKHSDRSILHTLASVYAELERPAEAYRVLLQSLAAGDQKPAPFDWYVFGRMAETYGLPDLARSYYHRVEKPADYAKVSAFTLSERRLAALGPETKAAKKETKTKRAAKL